MTYVSSVRLKAFKSVGPQWVELDFERGLNAIVGPNGCGKSSLLDALCFAFAAPPRTFAAASLTELANSDTSEVCEVAVTLVEGRTGAAHAVHAALTPDGGRAYKVDGRARSGREVRDFLRGLGIRLDSAAAVIKQAQVTRLADSNSPADLAAVVAEASGLGRWNQEVAAAEEELRRTQRALGEVQASLAVLERGVAADAEKLKALEAAQAAEHEAASLAQSVAGLLQRAAAACAAAESAAQTDSEAAAASVAAAREGVGRLCAELNAAQAALAAAQREHSAGGCGGDLLPVQQQVAAAEEEVRLLAEREQRRHQLEAALQAEQAALARATAAQAAAAAELAAAQAAVQQVQQQAQQVRSAASADALRDSVAADVTLLQAELAARERAAEVAAAELEAAGARLAEATAERQRLDEELGDAQAALNGSGTGAAGAAQQQAALQEEARRLRASLAGLQQEEGRLAAEAGTLAARLARASGSSGSAAAGAWRPLHRCFRFSEPEGCQQYAHALQVLAGARLGVLVADSTAAAAQLLEGGSGASAGARIWPLDGIQAADHSRQQRAAAQRFPPGQVVLPADLLAFEPAARPAILRAFGSHVIAASDAVAGELVSRWGIPCVTPDGRLAARGSLQGGWRGDAGGPGTQGPMQLKLSLDSAEGRLAGVRQQAAQAQQALQAVEQRLAAAQEAAAAAAAAAEVAAAAEAEERAAQLELVRQQQAGEDARAALARLRADLAAKQALLASLQADASTSGTSGGGSAGHESAMAALAAEQRRLAAAAAALAQAAAAAAAEAAAAGDRVAELEGEAALVLQQGSCSEELAAAEARLGEASSALAAAEAEAAARSAAVAERQQAAECAAGRVATAEEALAASEAQAAAVQARVQAAAAERQQVQEQLAALVKEVPELAGAPMPGDPHSNEEASTSAALLAKADRLGRQRRKLQEERRRGPAAAVSAADQRRFQEQQATLAAARGQAATLATAAQRLQEGIAASSEQVLATNETVFRSVDAAFRALCAAVLPAYRVRLRKVGAAVHEGVRFEFAHIAGSRGGGARAVPSQEAEGEEEEEGNGSEEEGEEGGGGGGGWRSGLDALSGGQRTMVSLALVTSAATAGAPSSLSLLDEVDAALDESNQRLVARLFASLSGGAASAAQVLCVSHNASFQGLCGRVVRLTRGADGTKPAEGQSSARGRAAALAATDGGGAAKRARRATKQ